MKILIVDDEPLVRKSLGRAFKAKGHEVVEAVDGNEGLSRWLDSNPDVVFLDIQMPGMTGLEILKKLSETKTRTKVILLTLQNELSVFNYARQLGARGFLLKEFAMDEMEKCLAEVQIGNTYFSQQLNDSLHFNTDTTANTDLSSLTFAEKKILDLIKQQKSSKEIAAALFISEKTVETHRSHIMKKLNIPSGKNALLKWAIENGRG